MKTTGISWILTVVLAASAAHAQGARADYQRAEQVMKGSLGKLVVDGTVAANWLGQTSRMWYRKTAGESKEFIMIDAERLTRAPAFDHEKTDISKLLAAGWKQPERFKAKGRDGKTDIYGVLWRPTNFDPARKYPVIEQIYAGPHSFFAPATFAAHRNACQVFAELGFLCVMVDGMGTDGRSHAFHAVSHKNLGDGGLPDHITAIQQLASRYPFMDIGRGVGIYGHSAGGYNSTNALLTHPEFYKVAVSSAGNHDHRLDKAGWVEQWMGYPAGKWYEEQSNITLAPKLQGKLLLAVGDVDDNVTPVSTLKLAAALVQAGKDFDLIIMPNSAHGFGNDPYFVRRRWDFFVRHLMGVTPPEGYQINREEPAR